MFVLPIKKTSRCEIGERWSLRIPANGACGNFFVGRRNPVKHYFRYSHTEGRGLFLVEKSVYICVTHNLDP